jgi:hypothetical protein
MKVWKLSLLTTLVFSAFIIILLYTACEKNVCDNVTCFNGGSCNVGACRCPVGWEDPQCQTKSVKRYVGSYVGLTTCDMGTATIDSVVITADPNKINYVFVDVKSFAPRAALHGYVSSNASTYSIIVADDSALHYVKTYTVMLQGDKKLTINSFETNETVPADTFISKCVFVGDKYK